MHRHLRSPQPRLTRRLGALLRKSAPHRSQKSKSWSVNCKRRKTFCNLRESEFNERRPAIQTSLRELRPRYKSSLTLCAGREASPPHRRPIDRVLESGVTTGAAVVITRRGRVDQVGTAGHTF